MHTNASSGLFLHYFGELAPMKERLRLLMHKSIDFLFFLFNYCISKWMIMSQQNLPAKMQWHS